MTSRHGCHPLCHLPWHAQPRASGTNDAALMPVRSDVRVEAEGRLNRERPLNPRGVAPGSTLSVSLDHVSVAVTSRPPSAVDLTTVLGGVKGKPRSARRLRRP